MTLVLCFSSCSSDDSIPQEDQQQASPMEETPQPNDSDTEEEGLYFPPINAEAWESRPVEELGWDSSAEAALLAFLEEKNTKAFIILKDGRIALEAYFNGADADDLNPWFSAGKTLTAFSAGIAQQEGFLTLGDSSSDYMGLGWTSLEPQNESAIKVIHHLSMTTGLDYSTGDVQCTDADCLFYLNDPATFWYYHNAAYTLTQDIIAGAINDDFDAYFKTKIRDVIGMDGSWIRLGYANVYFSTARSMARFGLLSLNEGAWEDQQILEDNDFFFEMTNTSQEMNEAYGYLWWLNGKESYRLPASEMEFPGKLIPSAPDDLIAGLGKDDQKLYVVPSEGLVIVRMGDSAGEAFAGPSSFDTELWKKIIDLIE